MTDGMTRGIATKRHRDALVRKGFVIDEEKAHTPFDIEPWECFTKEHRNQHWVGAWVYITVHIKLSFFY